jgi:hypothetical protein
MLVVTNAYAFRSLLLLFVLIIVQCVATTHPPSVSPSRLLAKQQEPSHAHQQQQQHIEQSSATDLPNRDQDVRPASSESNDSDVRNVVSSYFCAYKRYHLASISTFENHIVRPINKGSLDG